jgi:hypothetical protein
MTLSFEMPLTRVEESALKSSPDVKTKALQLAEAAVHSFLIQVASDLGKTEEQLKREHQELIEDATENGAY